MVRDQRRLAAIVSADAAGYSRLMGEDESRTLAALKAHRAELIDPKISEYGGRIVKTTGDGLLLEFPSVVDAVRCAVDVQRGMVERNIAVLPERRIEFRIGINVGDIIIDGDDIFGNGVHVAARRQTLADPGGICVSKVVRDQVLDKLSFTFEDLGAQEVKNITRPVEVYRIRDASTGGTALAGQAKIPRARSGGRRFRAWWRWWMAGALTLGLGGIAAWQLPGLLQRPSFRPPSAFSVAVRPFVGATGVPADEQLAYALTENLRTLLGKSHLLTVVSGRRALSRTGKEINAHNVGRELGVRYLIDGEVRTIEGKTAISTHLIDAESGATVWSDRFGTRLQRPVEPMHLRGSRLRSVGAAASPAQGVAPYLLEI